MNSTRVVLTRISCSVILLVAWCVQADEPITPIPDKLYLDNIAVSLGERLFQDKILFKNNQLSCSVCHQLENGGDDNMAVSILNNGERGQINTPTVYNAGFNFRQQWDGRARNLEDQFNMVLTDAREHNISWKEVIGKLSADSYYSKVFKQHYSDGLTSENITDAIVQYEKSLITPNSRFDLFLKGDEKAITSEEKQGYVLFKERGCINCHQGINVGGNLYQKIGVFFDYLRKRGKIKEADYGRYNSTGRERDRFVFKVPGLRNVELTAPYFHDGQVQHLDDAVRIMGRTQIGTILDEQDVDYIVKFLRTLTGKYKGIKLSKITTQNVEINNEQ